MTKWIGGKMIEGGKGSTKKRRKEIGETEQDVIMRKAREKAEAMAKAKAEGRVEGQVTDKEGNVIRTPEQQKEFTKKMKDYRDEEFRPERAEEVQKLAQPDFKAKIPTIQQAPLGLGKEVFQQGTEGKGFNPALAESSFVQATAATSFLEEATVDQLRQAGFSELDIQVLDAGKGKIDKFNQIISGLPGGIGRRRVYGVSVSDFAGTSPTKKIDELMKSIRENSETISTSLTNAEAKPLERRVWLAQAESSKNSILEAESEIKLLAIQNPEMLSEPQLYINVQTEILNIKLLHPEIFS